MSVDNNQSTKFSSFKPRQRAPQPPQAELFRLANERITSRMKGPGLMQSKPWQKKPFQKKGPGNKPAATPVGALTDFDSAYFWRFVVSAVHLLSF